MSVLMWMGLGASENTTMKMQLHWIVDQRQNGKQQYEQSGRVQVARRVAAEICYPATEPVGATMGILHIDVV